MLRVCIYMHTQRTHVTVYIIDYFWENTQEMGNSVCVWRGTGEMWYLKKEVGERFIYFSLSMFCSK